MARAGSTEPVDLPDVDAGLALARRMLAQGRPNEDHLCCGRFGLVDVLLTVGERLDRPDLVDQARARADDITRGRGPIGFVYTDRLPPTVFVPGLFTGAAGVGYEQLRLSDPETFPSVLLFETPRSPR